MAFFLWKINQYLEYSSQEVGSNFPKPFDNVFKEIKGLKPWSYDNKHFLNQQFQKMETALNESFDDP